VPARELPRLVVGFDLFGLRRGSRFDRGVLALSLRRALGESVGVPRAAEVEARADRTGPQPKIGQIGTLISKGP
jgi:hypothetical protein